MQISITVNGTSTTTDVAPGTELRRHLARVLVGRALVESSLA